MSIEFVDEFRNPHLVPGLLRKIKENSPDRTVRIMEVCGTHTMVISRSGIRTLLKENVTLISGPGCPVCVTPDGYIDAAITLAGKEDVLITTFGDMLKVPGTVGSLEEARAEGARVEIVYSPLDALNLAEKNPDTQVVFLGVGFETTVPSIAGAISEAREKKIENFSVLSSARTIPEAMEALLNDPEVEVEAFLCPAHVSTIIGVRSYLPIVEKYEVPCVVAGFEPLDVLLGVSMILEQLKNGSPRVENEYARVATWEGNEKAKELIYNIYEKSDAEWRGIGIIQGSGLKIRDEWKDYDAEERFGITVKSGETNTPCRCGDILKGKITPPECPLFGTGCTPEKPKGPCMVSSEGTCSAYYKYEQTGD